MNASRILLLSLTSIAICMLAAFATYCYFHHGEEVALNVDSDFAIANYHRACFLPTTCSMFDIDIQSAFQKRMTVKYVLDKNYTPMQGDLIVSSSVNWDYGFPPRHGAWRISFFMPARITINVVDGMNGKTLLACIYSRSFFVENTETWHVGQLINSKLESAFGNVNISDKDNKKVGAPQRGVLETSG